MDPFGNRVAPDGRSVDSRGRSVDPATYVMRDGAPVRDAARDAQYTRELGEAICRAYSHETVLMSTHLVAGAAFARLRAAFPRADLFTVLRHRDEVRVSRAALAQDVGDLRDRARELEDRTHIVLGPGVRKKGAMELLDEAVRAWSGYHSFPVLRVENDGYVLSDTNLLFYYQNRLAASGLGYSVAHGASATASGGAARAALGGAR
jgi:glycerol-3-phosphate O-acyltransferase